MEKKKTEDACFRYLAKEGSKEERFLFELELSLNEELKKEFDTYKSIWEAYPLDYVEIQPERSATDSKRPRRPKYRGVLIAFSAALSLALGWLLLPDGDPGQRNHISTHAGERVTFYLPDSSKVILNAQSDISYERDFLNHRKVQLKGEAFFEVARREGQPFQVFSDDIEVLVLGTEFNVRTTDSVSTVSLESGKVSMRIPENGTNITLWPKEEVAYHPQSRKLDKRAFDPSRTLAWKEEELLIQDSSLLEALPMINNYYGARFIPQDSLVGQKSIVGHFKGKDIKEFVEALEFITGFTIEKKESRTYLIRSHED